MAAEQFGAEELRRRVLEAWRQSPARFRADANVEDDLARTGYRDRVVVELAQNAADAATRAGVSGRLVLRLVGDVLTVANTGAALEAAGVESISVARASAKRGQHDVVGRFGVGFAAVLAVSDEPSITSTTGSVRWSLVEAAAAVAAVPELSEELATSGGRVPVLRLPWSGESSRSGESSWSGASNAAADRLDGTATVVTLPLRDAEATSAVRTQLHHLDATILLALEALGEVLINIDGDERVLSAERDDRDGLDGRHVRLRDGDEMTRWRLARSILAVPDHLRDVQAVEDRRPSLTVTWALPVDAHDRLVALPQSVARVVHAPTPTDDAQTLPALLFASYPLDAARRRVTSGALADAVTGQAAQTLVEALTAVAADPSVLRAVPVGLPGGELDGALHAAVQARMESTAWLPVAGQDEARQRPPDAVVVADPLVEVLTGVVPGLLPVGWSRPELAALGVRRLSIEDLVEALATVDAAPRWWHRLYAALEHVVEPGPERDALGALPVPLIDGTLTIGPRGVALPGLAVGVAHDLGPLGVRIAHPEAAHPLLQVLGAVEGSPRDLLELPSVRAAVEASYDEDDPAPIADAVLSLLVDAPAETTAALPWLAELAVTDTTGEWRPAGELVLADGLMARVIAPDSAFGVVAPEWAERWGREAVVATGVLDGPAVLREADVLGPNHDLDDEAGWWATLPPESSVPELVALRDLEQVRADALAELLEAVARSALRAVVVEPAIVELADGSRRTVRSYTAWWLSSRPVLDGRAPRDLRLVDSAPELNGLYDAAPLGHDPELLRALGMIGSLGDADPADVLARMADPSRPVGRAQLRTLDAWLADHAADPPIDPPDLVRAVRAGAVVVLDAAAAVIIDAPDLIGLVGGRGVVPVAWSKAGALADRLDVALASELARYDVLSAGTVVDEAVVHDELWVADADGVAREVAWRLVEGTLHVDARRKAFGLGRGRAWRDGRWAQRHRLSEVLESPQLGMLHSDEDDLDDSNDA